MIRLIAAIFVIGMAIYNMFQLMAATTEIDAIEHATFALILYYGGMQMVRGSK